MSKGKSRRTLTQKAQPAPKPKSLGFFKSAHQSKNLKAHKQKIHVQQKTMSGLLQFMHTGSEKMRRLVHKKLSSSLKTKRLYLRFFNQFVLQNFQSINYKKTSMQRTLQVNFPSSIFFLICRSILWNTASTSPATVKIPPMIPQTFTRK